ncbi:MAG: hypothetical protein AB1894_28745 [Chloroflexota bacterium]
MLPVLVAFPVFSLLLILQSAVLGRVPLIMGTADLVMLAIIAWSLHPRVKSAWQWGLVGGALFSYVSALPYASHLIGYLLVVGFAQILRQRVWQAPLMAMFFATFVGTLVVQSVDLILLSLSGNPLSWLQAVNLISLPSLLLNLLFAVPAYAVFGDLANWLHPEQLEM